MDAGAKHKQQTTHHTEPLAMSEAAGAECWDPLATANGSVG
jgi:hypothetical protein